MTTIKEYNGYGETLEKLLLLRTSPLAIKMIEKETDIPEDAFRPEKDRGYHYAQCQAFALSRREKMTVAMLKEDNWCPAPITAYGLDEIPERPNMRAGEPMSYEKFEPGEYERALGGEDEMMFSVPADKVDGLISDLIQSEGRLGNYITSNMIMMPNFPQPEHYKMAFKRWAWTTIRANFR